MVLPTLAIVANEAALVELVDAAGAEAAAIADDEDDDDDDEVEMDLVKNMASMRRASASTSLYSKSGCAVCTSMSCERLLRMCM